MTNTYLLYEYMSLCMNACMNSYAFGMGYYNHISQPIRVFCFLDSFGLEELVNFFIDRHLPFWGETSSFLFDGSEGGTDVQLVCD